MGLGFVCIKKTKIFKYVCNKNENIVHEKITKSITEKKTNKLL